MTLSRVELAVPGLTISRLMAGCWRLLRWNLGSDGLTRWIEQCIELGITSFDHADIYGDYAGEQAFGTALSPALRQRIEIITKCGICLVSPARPEHWLKHYDTSGGHIISSVERSLRALRTDRVEVLLLHRPDPLMCADEVARAFDSLYRAGKVRAFGVSNFEPGQVELLQSRWQMPLVTNQIEFHVGRQKPTSDGTLDQCQRLKMAPMAWSPLGGGALFWAQADPWPRIRDALGRVGQRHENATWEQIAIAWLLGHPACVVPVLGSGRIERLASMALAENIVLDRQEWFSIREASAGQPVP